MKKFLGVFLIVLMVSSMVPCNANNDSKSNVTNVNTSSVDSSITASGMTIQE